MGDELIEQDSTVEERLIEAGDALAEAASSGNTGVMQNALDGWEDAKSAALAATVEGEFDVEAFVASAVEDVPEVDGEPGDDPDAGQGGDATSEPVNPTV